MVVEDRFRRFPLPESSRAQEFSVAAGDVIFNRQQPPVGLYLIGAGLAQTGVDGSSRTLQLARPGDMIGFGSLREISREWALAVSDTLLLPVDKIELPRLLIENSPFRAFVIDQLLGRLARTEAHLHRCCEEPLPIRLASTLLELVDPLSSAARTSISLPPVPHRILASYLGTSREMVTVVLNRFKRLGLVHYTRREMFINAVALHRVLMAPPPMTLFPSSGINGS